MSGAGDPVSNRRSTASTRNALRIRLLGTFQVIAGSGGTLQITSKWTDPEGTTWYKYHSTITAGPYKGFNISELVKVSNSAAVRESVWTAPTNEQEATMPTYPTVIDPKNSEYEIYYRAGG